MLTAQSGRKTSNEQELLVVFTHISLLPSSQGQVQEIVASAPFDRI